VPVWCDGPVPAYHAFEVLAPIDRTALRLEEPTHTLPGEEVITTLQRIAREVDGLATALDLAREVVPPPRPEPVGLEKLSAREREVLAGLIEGKRPRGVAQELFVSVHTVRNHVKAIFRKLEVHSQVELVRKLGGWDPARREE
jgi:DNA-binding NarL/FixJ family response regulator